jgi:hypothetical protein
MRYLLSDQNSHAIKGFLRISSFRLKSHWNVRIYNNIVNLIDSSSERILVIYGAGHLG